MTTTARVVSILVAVLLQATPAAQTALEGFVKAAAGEQAPLSGARVELLDGSGTPLVTLTDAVGHFSFPRLTPGRYGLRVTKNGFVRQEYGQRAIGVPGSGLILTAGQPRMEVFLLDRAPSIIGQVLNEYGEGKPYVLVQALRFEYSPRGNRLLVPTFSAQTDDKGNYRMYWVDPGEYVISASYTPEAMASDEALGIQRTTQSYPTLYFPEWRDPALAEPVEVAGDEVRSIGFKFVLSSTTGFKGDSLSLSSIANPFVGVISLIRSGVVEDRSLQRLATNLDAPWGFRVPPGWYTLVGRTNDGLEMGTLQVEVLAGPPASSPIPWRMYFSTGAALSGRVSVESVSAVDLRATRIGLTSIEPLIPSVESDQLEADGSFKLKGVLDGDYLLNVSGLPGETYVATASSGTSDLLADGLKVSMQQPLEPLRVTLKSDGGYVHGSVLDVVDRPSPGATVVLVPDLASRRRLDRYKVVTSDLSGSFAIHGVPPGAYKLFSWEYVRKYAYLNADFLSNDEDRGVPIDVSSGQNAPVSIPVIPSNPRRAQ